ncbi:MAG: sugar phosphate isomerase/epimerase [bacterium]
MKLSFSTCWNSWRHPDGRAMVEEILSLGFDSLELSHGIRSSQLEGVLLARERRKFRVSSIHNFLPMPVEVPTDSPDCYEFTSHRAKDRERALRLTLSTIDWAEKLGAPFVIVHTGRIRSLHLTAPLRKMVEKGKLHSREFVKQKLEAVRARERASGVQNARVLEMLQEAVAHAGKRGVKLGIENREYYEAVPSERDFPDFLKRLDSAHSGYWHDFGHAQIKHNLGLIDHAQHLERMAPVLLGCHVHDTSPPFRDHRPPFTGGTPFDQLVPLLPRNCATVLEMSPRTEAADIVKAAREWNEKFN